LTLLFPDFSIVIQMGRTWKLRPDGLAGKIPTYYKKYKKYAIGSRKFGEKFV